MHPATMLMFNLILHVHRIAARPHHTTGRTSVNTTSGNYIGHPAPNYPNVTEFLGITYGAEPTGNLRFAPPVAFVSGEVFEADTQPLDCPYVAEKWGSVPGQAWTHADRIMSQESADGYNAMSEDCLKMNIWAPPAGGAPKSVMIWLYGGGFERGSINNPAYNGANLVANEDVIVVSFNFRVNILGFSNAPGTTTNNGLRDVRLAVEWVRDNIAAFGGDPNSITLFGQSQGAYLISYYAFAYPQDPIAHAFIQQSGSAWSPILQNTTVKAATWSKAATFVGCNQTDNSQVVDCMRSQNISTVLSAMQGAPATISVDIPFGPVIDDELVFANYTQRTLEHNVSSNPLLTGNNDNEGAFYVFRWAGTDKFTLNQTTQDYITYGDYVCPGAIEAAARAAAGYPVYRYEYMGDWPNLQLYAGSRAYHTAETSVVFGTMEDLSGDPNTELEVAVSRYMQNAWASFAKDPQGGLKSLGWPTYDPNADTLIQLANGSEVTASYVSPNAFDAICSKLA